MARPRLKIDRELVEKLAMIQCTCAEIGAVVGCSGDTIERRFADLIAKGADKGRMSIRRKQFELMNSGNATMCIWLGKQYLGQSDKSDFTSGGKAVEGFSWTVVADASQQRSPENKEGS